MPGLLRRQIMAEVAGQAALRPVAAGAAARIRAALAAIGEAGPPGAPGA